MINHEDKQYQYILYEKWNRIAYVTINRPEVMNALHPPAITELNEIWSDFIADDELWVAIFTGVGERAFSAGADLKYFTEKENEQELHDPDKHLEHVLDQCHKPVIAALNGYAVGGGLEMALRCDIIIAAEHAKLGLPEPRRGLLADTGGVLKLPHRIPYHLAMGMILTGKLITAQEAYRMGIVNEVVPMADLQDAAKRWALEILECAPLSVQAAKQIVVETQYSLAIASAKNIEKFDTVRRLRESNDFKDGPKAFAEKRKPVWKGK